MSIFKLSAISESRLAGVHPDLVRVVHKAIAITRTDFGVACGLRTLKEQKYLYSIGKTRTMHSRHLSGHAVDLCPVYGGKWNWDDPDMFEAVAEWVKKAAGMENVPVEWGGDWTSFTDMPHFQLPWENYPLKDNLS